MTTNQSNTNSMTTHGVETDVITDAMMTYIYTINISIVTAVVSISGFVPNVLNLIIFYRLGFQDNVNISLFALSAADLLSLIFLLGVSICFSPFLMYSGLPVITKEIQLNISWVHILFVRVSGLITAFITFDRCICISFPLKVKKWLPPKRVKLIIFFLYAIPILTMFPNYVSTFPGWKFVPSQNKSMIGVINSPFADEIYSFSHFTQPFFPVFTFTTVAICSYILIIKLRQRSKWLKDNVFSSNASAHKLTARDHQVAKMVFYTAVIFIFCYTPSLCSFIIMISNTKYFIGGAFENSILLFNSVAFTFGGINASANIFVYFKTNSKYRKNCKMLFCSTEEYTQ